MTTTRTAKDAAVRSITIMTDGERADFDDVIAAGAINRESGNEPLRCRVGGPAGFHGSALWLRGAFDQLTWQVRLVVADGDLVVVDTTMRGLHVRDFVLYGPDGEVERAYAPTGKTFAVQQSHWFRMACGQVAEHWAVRDDLGQALQLGWVPPTPAYLARCWRSAHRARRAAVGVQ